MAQRNFSVVYRLAQFAASQGNEVVERKRKIYASKYHFSICLLTQMENWIIWVSIKRR
ncbi:hypothetical protein Ccrd_025233 [Cynara cardunculus var. scolymus]|uniref:Uncharacterized protein n=1 Tax=Cynara cardunculus var. scolymus TaxID=59895 RepID=A0A124SAH6_CYNCS|nr:hypothetical protein Ccrd_025233 [Cynara cardunculus var. scolymus]